MYAVYMYTASVYSKCTKLEKNHLFCTGNQFLVLYVLSRLTLTHALIKDQPKNEKTFQDPTWNVVFAPGLLWY